MSREQLYRPECRDVSFNKKRSRQEQAVATPPSLKTCHNNTEAPATRPATKTATRPATRTDVTTRALHVATVSVYWASSLKSKKKCIEIRAQLQNPINMQLQRRNAAGWQLEREIWVAEGSCIFIFIFFSFIFLSFIHSFDFILD